MAGLMEAFDGFVQSTHQDVLCLQIEGPVGLTLALAVTLVPGFILVLPGLLTPPQTNMDPEQG